ncbi:MAG: HAD-IIIA family hydrolase [Bryobacteraceae bacterium]|jgi:D-glycero-D-manno-heptose 1,7-bisphosphate phosphatase
MNRAVFLDRDGVLTRALVRGGKAYAPITPAEMEIDADAPAALARLKAAGFLLIVVTNQPDVARGVTRLEDVEAMHATLRAALPLDAVCVCYHDDRDACDCRKPKPGMLFAAAAAHEVDLGASFMVGDRWRDVEAGAAAGCRTIWIDRGYDERAPVHTPDARVDSLRAAAHCIESL